MVADGAYAAAAATPPPRRTHAPPLRPFCEVVPEPTLAERLRALLPPLPRRLPRSLALLEWRAGYSRVALASDVLAACVVTTVLLPQALAYALLAGVDPVYGLYSSVAPLITFGLLTTSSSLAGGPVAPTCILMNSMVRELTGAEDRTPAFTAATLQLAFASGVVLAGMSLLQLSFIADLLSFPVISGYTSGAACIIIASQLSDLFGIPVPKEREFFKRLRAAGENAGRAHGPSAAIGAVCLLVLLYAKDVRLRGWALPKLTPVPLLVIALATALSYGLDWAGAGVKIVGDIPSVLPAPSFPFAGPAGGADFLRVLPPAALLSVVSFVQTLSVGTVFAQKKGERLLAGRELFAVAASNLVGGCFQCIQVSGSFTRTAVQYGAGAATPAAGILVGLLMIVAILTLTRVLRFLPMAVLAAVVVSSTRALLEPTEALALWRGKPTDFLQLAVTFVAVLVLDVQNGLFAGIGFSLALVLFRAFQPRMAELARLPGTDTYVALARYPSGLRPRGIVVLRLDGEISFGNCRKLGQTLRGALERAPCSAPARDGDSGGGGGGGGGGGCGCGASAPTDYKQLGSVGDESGKQLGPPRGGGDGGVAASGGTGGGHAARRTLDSVSGGARRGAGSSTPHTRKRTVYALASLLADGRDTLASLLLPAASSSSAPGQGGADPKEDGDGDGGEDECGADGGRGAATSTGAAAARVSQQQLLRSRHRAGGEPGGAATAGGAAAAAAAATSATASPADDVELAHLGGGDGSGGTRGVPADAASCAPGSDGSAAAATARSSGCGCIPLRAVILDCSRVSDVDATGCRELREVLAAFDAARVPLLLAGLPGPVRDTMTAFGIDALDSQQRAADAATGAGGAWGAAAAGGRSSRSSGGGWHSALSSLVRGRAAAIAGRDGGGGGGGSGSGGDIAAASAASVVGTATPPSGDASLDAAAPQLTNAPSAAGPPHGTAAAAAGASPPPSDGARRTTLRTLATRYLSVSAAVAAVEAAYGDESGAGTAASATLDLGAS